MAKYATNEKQYHCDRCEKWITEREMVSEGIFMNAQRERHETFSAHCPGCRVTKWTRIVTMGAIDERWRAGYFENGQPENWPYELINDDELL